MFLLCDATRVAIGSRFSMRGDPRLDEGEAAKGFVKAEGGVGNGVNPFGERLISTALSGVPEPDVMVAGVMSCVLLLFGCSTSGAGEPSRSPACILGGTSGGSS
jgi:hypothetical protein